MFPYPHDSPTASCENQVVSKVPLDISRDFDIPIVRVCRGPYSVLGTAVPKATVDEDRKTGSAKNYVCATTKVSFRAHPQPEPEPATI